MSDKTMPLPGTGGSFIRQADGSLRPAHEAEITPIMATATPETEPEPEPAAARKAGKQPVKEA